MYFKCCNLYVHSLHKCVHPAGPPPPFAGAVPSIQMISHGPNNAAIPTLSAPPPRLKQRSHSMAVDPTAAEADEPSRNLAVAGNSNLRRRKKDLLDVAGGGDVNGIQIQIIQATPKGTPNVSPSGSLKSVDGDVLPRCSPAGSGADGENTSINASRNYHFAFIE